jgi:hypothetical protein
MAIRPYRARGTHRANFLSGLALFVLLNVDGSASAQTQLPEVVVSAPKEKPKPKPRTTPVRFNTALLNLAFWPCRNRSTVSMGSYLISHATTG